MAQSPILGLPFIEPSQAQKHVTHNEAIRVLDAVAQIAVGDRDLTTPPGISSEGDRFIVAPGGTGAWSGHDGDVTVFIDGYWDFHAPVVGWIAWVEDEGQLVAWDGTGWVKATVPDSIETAQLGVNTAVDATNRLSVKSDAVLFSHDDVTPGSGDARVVVNKNIPGQTASVLFQSGWSGRAEFGLAGDDDWQVKVSPDGTTWHQALVVEAATGNVGLGTANPSTVLHVEGPARVGQYSVASLPDPAVAGAGAIVFVSDESGGATLAYSDSSNWRRTSDRAVVA